MTDKERYLAAINGMMNQGYCFEEADWMVNFIIKRCDAYAISLKNGQIAYALEARKAMEKAKKKS